MFDIKVTSDEQKFFPNTSILEPHLFEFQGISCVERVAS